MDTDIRKRTLRGNANYHELLANYQLISVLIKLKQVTREVMNGE